MSWHANGDVLGCNGDGISIYFVVPLEIGVVMDERSTSGS